MYKGSIVVAVLKRSDRLEPRYKLSTLLYCETPVTHERLAEELSRHSHPLTEGDNILHQCVGVYACVLVPLFCLNTANMCYATSHHLNLHKN